MLDFFFFNNTATTEIYTLSLHDALPISGPRLRCSRPVLRATTRPVPRPDWRARYRERPARRGRGPVEEHSSGAAPADRKSTRLNSSHANISYAVLCLKKKDQCVSETRYS